MTNKLDDLTSIEFTSTKVRAYRAAHEGIVIRHLQGPLLKATIMPDDAKEDYDKAIRGC